VRPRRLTRREQARIILVWIVLPIVGVIVSSYVVTR
jgi:hypothetical protein